MFLKNGIKICKWLKMIFVFLFGVGIWNQSISMAIAGQMVPASAPELVATIPWKTSEYVLPPGMKKFFLGINGNFYFVFDESVYAFNKDGKHLGSSGILDGSFLGAEMYQDGSIGLLHKKLDTHTHKVMCFAVRLDPNVQFVSKKEMTSWDVKEEFEISKVSLRNGDVYLERKGRRMGGGYFKNKQEKINSAFDLGNSEKNVRNARDGEPSGDDKPNPTGDIESATNKKIWMVPMWGMLTRFSGSVYYWISGMKDAKTRHRGIYIKHLQSGDWQYFLFPPKEGHNKFRATYDTPPAVANDGSVYYLYDDSMVGRKKGISVYHLPVHW